MQRRNLLLTTVAVLLSGVAARANPQRISKRGVVAGFVPHDEFGRDSTATSAAEKSYLEYSDLFGPFAVSYALLYNGQKDTVEYHHSPSGARFYLNEQQLSLQEAESDSRFKAAHSFGLWMKLPLLDLYATTEIALYCAAVERRLACSYLEGGDLKHSSDFKVADLTVYAVGDGPFMPEHCIGLASMSAESIQDILDHKTPYPA